MVQEQHVEAECAKHVEAECAKHVEAECAKLFQKSWQTYQTVLKSNDLCHQEIAKSIKEDIHQEIEDISLCDLACGDSWLPSQIFNSNGRRIKRYTGVDASQMALDIAKNNVKCGEMHLIEADVLDFLRETSETFDVFLVSLMLHHFSAAGKLEALQLIYSRMKEGGTLYYADIYNAFGCPRDELMQNHWKQRVYQYKDLSEEQKDEVWTHISTLDQPESIEDMERLMSEAGFHDIECLFKDGFYIATFRARK